MKKFFLSQVGLYLVLLAGCSGPAAQNNNPLLPPAAPRQDSVSTESAPPAAAVGGIQEVRSVIPLDDPSGTKSRAPNFYLFLDDSQSMDNALPYDAGRDPKIRTRLDGAKWALKEYVRILPKNANVGLAILNNGNYREVIRLTSVSEPGFLRLFDQTVGGLSSVGNTPLGGAIKFGTDQLVAQYKRQLGFGTYKLVLITDGADNGNIPLYQAAEYKNYFGIPLHTIGYALSSDHALRQYRRL